MTRLLAAGAALLLALSFATAATAEESPFDRHLDQALEHYDAKRYDAAIRAFEAAYAIRPEPELIYNVARSHEKALHRQEAIAAYERFLELPGTTAALRSKALAAMEALRNEQAAISSRPKPPKQDPKASTDTSKGTITAKTRPPSPDRSLEWGLIGGGGTAVVAGTVFGVLALMDRSDFDDATTRTEQVRSRDAFRRNAIAADVLIGLGLVTAGVGAGLLLWRPAEEPTIRLQPSMGKSGASLTLLGRF